MPQQNEKIRRKSGEKNIRDKRGKKIDKKLIAYLLSKLQSYISTGLANDGGRFTKDSVKPLKSFYENKILHEYKDKSRKEDVIKYRALELVSTETIANLFDTGMATTSSLCISQLAGLILFTDRVITDIEVCTQQIIKKESWGIFIEHYQSKIDDEVLREPCLFYYWKDGHVHMAEMIFRLNAGKTKWEDCEVTYYDYDSTKFEFTKNLTGSEAVIINKSGHNSLSLYISHDWQIAQITITIPSDIQHRQVFICSYSTHTKSGIPFSGIAILRKYDDTAGKIREINLLKKVDDEIFNALYETSNMLVYNPSTSGELPNTKDVMQIKMIQGVWKVFYLRSSKPEGLTAGSDETGGIEQSYLKIEPSGKVYFKTDESGDSSYQGFLSYPMFDNKKLIKINLVVSEKNKDYKIQMSVRTNDKKNILEGVMSGSSNKGRPFGGLARLEKITGYSKTTDEYFRNAAPKFYRKTELENAPDISNSLLTFLRNTNKFLDVAIDCIPFTPVGDKNFFEKLSGNFYLLSRDYQEGLLDKAKLKILKNGDFQIEYPDVSYKGYTREFITNSTTDKYIYLDVMAKRPVNSKWSNFSGGLLFNIGNLLSGKSYRLSENAEVLVGLSLRKNIDNFLQTKKEILIAAESAEEFEKEESKKYPYSEEENLIKNLKNNSDNENFLNPENYKSIIRNLRGKENNIMLIPNNEIAAMSFRETDYFEIYMNAFLFEIIFSHKIDYPKIYNYLLQSLLHLDNTDKLIHKIKEIFIKHKINIESKKKVFEDINWLYSSVIEMGKNGQLRKLFKILKAPTAYQKNSPILIKINEIIQQIRKL